VSQCFKKIGRSKNLANQIRGPSSGQRLNAYIIRIGIQECGIEGVLPTANYIRHCQMNEESVSSLERISRGSVGLYLFEGDYNPGIDLHEQTRTPSSIMGTGSMPM
jgi:hypothetical protein